MRFYQVGSFAAGNRLVDEGDRTVQSGPGPDATRSTRGTGPARDAARRSGARYVLDAAMRSATAA